MIDGRPTEEIARDDRRTPNDCATRYRAMDTSLGRWTRQDPAGYVDGNNRYLANTGNPLIYTDPAGLQSVMIGPDGERPPAFGLPKWEMSDHGWRQYTNLRNALAQMCYSCQEGSDLNCDYSEPIDECLRQASSLALAITRAVDKAKWSKGPQFGGNTGNRTGQWQCGDWQNVIIAEVQPLLTEWRANGVDNYFGVDLFNNEQRPYAGGWLGWAQHSWMQVRPKTWCPGVLPISIDPWPSAGERILDNSEAQAFPAATPVPM